MNHIEGFYMPNQTVFEQQMEELRIDMREMRTAVTQMATAMTKLSVLEERNMATIQAIDKVTSRMDKMEDKLSAIELEQVKFEATIDGVTKTAKAMWAVVGGGVIYLGSQVIQHFVG